VSGLGLVIDIRHRRRGIGLSATIGRYTRIVIGV